MPWERDEMGRKTSKDDMHETHLARKTCRPAGRSQHQPVGSSALACGERQAAILDSFYLGSGMSKCEPARKQAC